MKAAGFAIFDTVLGGCGIAWRPDAQLGEVIVGVQLPADEGEAATRSRMQRRFPGAPEAQQAELPGSIVVAVQRVVRQLAGDAAPQDDLLDLPLDMEGVPEFNQRVYEVSRRIPPGKTMTYGEMARELGDPLLARAVGQALGHNPFAPVVPCHRILAADRASGGFSAGGGVATKLKMLQAERAQFGDQPGLF